MPTGEFLGFLHLTWQATIMLVIGGVLMWLGIAKKMEPYLLVPIGFGCLLANIQLGGAAEAGGFLAVLREAGIRTEIFPLLIFIAIGAMIDFEPFLQRPYTIFLGGAAQFGIFATFFLAYLLGDGWLHVLDFTLQDAAAIGTIGSADGPTSIYVATMLQSKYTAAIFVAAYSYMAMVPIIQPPIIKAMCSKEETGFKNAFGCGNNFAEYKDTLSHNYCICGRLACPKSHSAYRLSHVWQSVTRMRSGGETFPGSSK